MAPLPAPPAEVPVESSLQALAPRFREALGRVCADLTAWGYAPRVFETLRTDARQRFLFDFGRSYDDGRGVVTQSATAVDTWHGYGLAADIICARRLWDAPEDFWQVLGCSARRHGLVWGGDWNSNWSSADERFVDRPHIQWGAPARRSPSARAAELLRTGGMAAVWAEVDAA
jgi:hypothetical protein